MRSPFQAECLSCVRLTDRARQDSCGDAARSGRTHCTIEKPCARGAAKRPPIAACRNREFARIVVAKRDGSGAVGTSARGDRGFDAAMFALHRANFA